MFLWILWSDFLNYFRVIFSIIKLAQDALKELAGIKFCKYEFMIAILLKMWIVQD